MTTRRAWLAAVAGGALAGCAAPRGEGAADHAARVAAVTVAERAFARTMAERDHAAFLGFVAEEAVFLNGGTPLVGRDAIGAHWRRFFEGAQAPFAWAPDLVVVLASGRLAESTGLVTDPAGQAFSRFQSTWRLEPDGRWRVVFDNGHRLCRCAG